MDRQPTLYGERLLLRPLRSDDWAALFKVAADPQIWARHPSHDRWQEPVFREFFEEAMAGGGAFAIIDKASGALIGSTRYGEAEPAADDSIEIGWSFLAHAFWGRGYNAEFKRLLITHALKYVGRVTFQVGVDNVISRRAMENIGGILRPEPGPVYERCGEMVEHVVFDITRASFAAGPLG